MATPAAYEGSGGAGGKLRKRSARHAPATPYDRPASAARGGARDGESLPSRIVGTASRLIAGGATRIFGSLLGRRLEAPLEAAQEENLQRRQEVPGVACINPFPELLEEGGGGETRSSGLNSPDTDGISELEKILKEKSFSRAESDHLTELLRSRTIEQGTLEPAAGGAKRENEDNPSQDNELQVSTKLTVPRDELASPAELAKAYMDSIPSKVPPSSLSLRSHMFHEDASVQSIVPFVSKPLKRPAVPRSVHFSATPELSKNAYQTPISRGASAIRPMYTSPFFKARPKMNIKGGELIGAASSGPSSSRQNPRDVTDTGRRQVLKRRNSVLDSDFDSFGPIRRIRRKFQLTPPSRKHQSVLSNKEVYGSFSVGNTNLHETEDRENTTFPASVTPIPPKSSETAMKILKQLDILASPTKELKQGAMLLEAENKKNKVSSPSETGMKILQHLDVLVSPSKEKSSEPKTATKDESPSTSTHSLLSGTTPKNMEAVKSPTYFNGQDNNSSLRSSLFKHQDRVEENGHSHTVFSGVKFTSESGCNPYSSVPPADCKPSTSTINISVPGSAQWQSSCNQMSTPKGSVVLDHENHSRTDASSPSSTKSGDTERKTSNHISGTSERATPVKSLTPSSISGSGLGFKEADMKGSGLVFSGKDTGFSFSSASGLSTQSPQPPSPTMPGTSVNIPALQKEQMVAPVFGFGSNAAPGFAGPTMASISKTPCQKVDARDAMMVTAMEGSSPSKLGELSKDANSSQVFGSTSATNTTQSNGSLFAACPGLVVSSSPSQATSPFFSSTTFANGTTPTTNMSSPAISPSPAFSMFNSSNFGTSAAPPNNSSSSTVLASSTASPSTGSIFKFGATAQATTSNLTQSGTGGSQLPQNSNPFGSFSKSPSTGFGSSSFLFGIPASETKTNSGFAASGFSASSGPSTTASIVSAPNLFNSSSQPLTSSVFGFTTGSASSPSTGSLFGNSSSALGSSSSPFASAATPVFSFTSAIATTSRATSPAGTAFGMPTSTAGFGPGSTGNDKMNAESTMNNAPNQPAAPTASIFGFPTNSPTTSTVPFASGASPGGPPVSQFAGFQNPPTQGQTFQGFQNPLTQGQTFQGFQNSATQGQTLQAGNLGFAPGGGFSLGTGGGGGGDKAGRRVIKIKRDKKSRK